MSPRSTRLWKTWSKTTADSPRYSPAWLSRCHSKCGATARKSTTQQTMILGKANHQANPVPNGNNRMNTIRTAKSISRRRFLRGLGMGLALPAFESFLPSSILASTPTTDGATPAPVRMAFVYFPNGAMQDPWWPTGEGREFELNRTMQPLASVKNHIQV